MLSIHLFVRRPDRTTDRSKRKSAKFRCDEHRNRGKRPSVESNGKARTRSEWYDVCANSIGIVRLVPLFFGLAALQSALKFSRNDGFRFPFALVCGATFLVLLVCCTAQMHLYTHARTHHNSSVSIYQPIVNFDFAVAVVAVYRPAENFAPRTHNRWQQTDTKHDEKLCVLCLLYT